jgi:hypothetical protein
MILTLPKNNNKDDFAGIFVVSRNDCVYLWSWTLFYKTKLILKNDCLENLVKTIF